MTSEMKKKAKTTKIKAIVNDKAVLGYSYTDSMLVCLFVSLSERSEVEMN